MTQIYWTFEKFLGKPIRERRQVDLLGEQPERETFVSLIVTLPQRAR